MSDQLEHYRQRVAGTNIDPRSLLSTDYFNTFNSVIMLYGMLGEAPELLEEIEAWQFSDYEEHFKSSGLDFSTLAIEAYTHAPASLRTKFDAKVAEMRTLVEDSRADLRRVLDAGEKEKFAYMAQRISRDLQNMADAGGAIVHGYDAGLDQGEIDKLF